MKTALILLLLATSTSCALMKEIDNGLNPERVQKEKEAKAAAERKILEEQMAKDQVILDKINLGNTINLRIGMDQKEVTNVIMAPDSVSASETETVWHYRLYQYPNKSSKIFPYRVVFKNNKAVKFGVDQEQVERDKAQVVIQKDMASDKKTP